MARCRFRDVNAARVRRYKKKWRKSQYRHMCEGTHGIRMEYAARARRGELVCCAGSTAMEPASEWFATPQRRGRFQHHRPDVSVPQHPAE